MKKSGGEGTSTPAATTKPATDTGETTPSQVTKNSTEDDTSKTPSKESVPETTIKTKEDAFKILDAFGAKPDAQSPTGFSTKNGTPIEEPLLRSALIAQGVDGDKVISLVKSPSAPKAQSASPITNNMDIKLPSEQSSGATASSGGGAGGVSASSTTPGASESEGAASGMSPIPESSAEAVTPKASGSQLGKLSGDVAEGQRLDSAPDAGTVVNSSNVNNNKGSVGKDSTKIADAYNTDFVQNYLQPAV